MTKTNAQILREYGPFEGADRINGVTFDGEAVWVATGPALRSLDPETGHLGRSIPVPADAGTAFDGRYLYQIGEASIRKIDPESGTVLATLPAPGAGGDSGMAWAEGSLWVGNYRERTISQIDPETGEVLKAIFSDRFVTGVTWLGGELWHATWEEEESTLRHIDPSNGAVLEERVMPDGMVISGLESDGKDRFFCGGGTSGVLRALRR